MKITTALMGALAVIISHQAYAQAPKATTTAALNSVVQLIKDGTFMDVKQVATAIGEPALYGQMALDDDMVNVYEPTNATSPYQTIRHEVMLSSIQHSFSEVTGMVEFAFKPTHCPSVSDVEKATGVKAQKSIQPTSPDLYTGRGGSYTVHYFDLPNGKTLSLIGCRISVYTTAKLS